MPPLRGCNTMMQHISINIFSPEIGIMENKKPLIEKTISGVQFKNLNYFFAKSNRSKFITLFQAATKSFTNLSFESLEA